MICITVMILAFVITVLNRQGQASAWRLGHCRRSTPYGMDKYDAHWRATLALCVDERSSLQFNAHKVLTCSDQPPFLPRRLGTLPYELRTVVVAEFNTVRRLD